MISLSKYTFFGTPDFAAIILEKLIAANIPPVLVVCNPDRPVGRKKIITPPPTKLLAIQHNIPVSQPEKLETDKLSSAEFAIVAAYSKILPKKIIDSLGGRVIGVHPSLLPKYRGPSPIQTAILNGDKETGVTLFLIDERVDRGPLLVKREVQITNHNYKELEKELAGLSGDLIIETLPKFIKGEIKPRPQDETQATYTKKFKTEDAFVDPDDLREAQEGASLEKAIKIERKIRALNPEPGVWTLRQAQGKLLRVKILEAEIVEGKLKLKKIQVEGKKPQELESRI